jgi:hypothetical protein
MIKSQEYSGKLLLNYHTRSEQLAIDELSRLLDLSPIENLIYILDGYDARAEAEKFPLWGMEKRRKQQTSSSRIDQRTRV